ncbi:MAG: ABC transporter permease subunit [Gammaproteobacteria bacterium]|nr:ABC transporter permease subunit [Gammaproteobacteria bacterium]
MILTIAKRELRGLFHSPLAWVCLAVVQIIVGFFFAITINEFIRYQAQLSGESTLGVTDIVAPQCMAVLSFVMLFIMPLLTPRLISGEHRNKTLPLLLAAPTTTTRIILGKFFAMLIFILITQALLFLMLLSLSLGTQLDWGQITTGIFGVLLSLGLFAAIGLYISTLNREPMVAGVLTYGALFLLWILGVGASMVGEAGEVLKWLSLTQHQDNFYRGLIDSRDLVYYGLFTGFFLLLSIRRLDAERLHA